jgi:hypothetical protein
VTVLKVPRSKIYEVRQDPRNEVFTDAQLISNYLAPYVWARVHPIPGATGSVGSALYPEGETPAEIRARTDSQEIEGVTFWLIGTWSLGDSNP